MGQPRAAFEPPPFDRILAVRGPHADSKAVSFLFVPVVRLVGAFHGLFGAGRPPIIPTRLRGRGVEPVGLGVHRDQSSLADAPNNAVSWRNDGKGGSCAHSWKRAFFELGPDCAFGAPPYYSGLTGRPSQPADSTKPFPENREGLRCFGGREAARPGMANEE